MEPTVGNEFSEGIFFQTFLPPVEEADSQQPAGRWVALLLHGWMGTCADLHTAASELAKAGLHAFVPDLPHHGRSRHTVAPLPSVAARKLLHALNGLLPPRSNVILMGYSMGGRLVLELLRIWDEISGGLHALKGAVILSAALPPQEEEGLQRACAREKKQADRMSTFADSTAFEKWLRSDWYSMPMWGKLATHPSFDALVDRRVCAFSPAEAKSWGDAAVNMGTSKMHPFVAKSSLPLLYIFGELDAKYRSMSAKYQAIFPSVRCVQVSQCGHNVIAESRREAIAAVLSFLLQTFADCRLRLRVCSLKTLDFVLPLVRGMNVGGRNVAEREGFLVAVALTNGSCGVGEVVPLPGWHRETLREAKEGVERVAEMLASKSFCPVDFRPSVDASIPNFLNAAVEAALVQALAAAGGTTVIDFLMKLKRKCIPDGLASGAPHQADGGDRVHINGVLPREILGSGQTLVDVANFISHSPFDVLKLKVGNQENIADEANRVITASTAAYKAGKSLRLDANRAWDRSQWGIFRDSVRPSWTGIEFIEEPLQSADLLLQALQSNEMPQNMAFGLDESLSDESTDACTVLMKSPACSAIVVKPSMFSSVMQVFEWTGKAGRSEAKVVISSTFESGAGLAWYALLAACCSEGRTAHGLGTYAHLAQDVISPSFEEFCTVPNAPYLSLQSCAAFLAMCCEKAKEFGSEKMDVQRHNV